MKTILMVPLVSSPITEFPDAVAKQLGFPKFLHGPLVKEKNVSIAEEKPPKSTARTTNLKTESEIEAAKSLLNRSGRPPVEINVKAALRMQEEGLTMRQIQQQLDCSLRSLERALADYKKNKWEF